MIFNLSRPQVNIARASTEKCLGISESLPQETANRPGVFSTRDCGTVRRYMKRR